MGPIVALDKNMTWDDVKSALPIYSKVEGQVVRHVHYGYYLDIGCNFEALVEIIQISDERKPLNPNDFPAIGSKVVAAVLGFRDRSQQIGLGTKASQLGA